ncbi:hypothetical protein M4I32_03070 [Microbacterium sp. LRZ72]|uniref:hypothetical protein n=1 Tax=Microbacterium sp. LRZ72 TaxID=2942481 RepID=UPI0029BAB634|nr:hypothetical protein [Microbacterium sp. LRZ72]MDX2375777.1 hypothetical protein [Microbacterium sp. LRZ72]
MTTTPGNPDPRGDDELEKLESESEDELLTPEETLFEDELKPEPTDAIGSVDWDETDEKA